MSCMSRIPPSFVVVAVAAATNVMPPLGERVASPTRKYVEAQCTDAAMGAGDPKYAGLEVRGSETEAKHRPVPTVRGVVDWYYGPTPGRYVALLDATRAGRPVHVRASVDLRSIPCRLATWTVGDGPPRSASTTVPSTMVPSTTVPSTTVPSTTGPSTTRPAAGRSPKP